MGIQINGQTDTIKAIDGSLTMPGTVTYEDVSRINVVGVVTAASFNSTTGNVTITENANVMFQNSARDTNRGAIQFNDSGDFRVRSGALLAETLRINANGDVNIGNKNHLSHHSTVDSLQIGYALNLYEDSYTSGTDNYVILGNNVYYNDGNKYMRNDEASRIMMQAGTFYFQSAAAGTAGDAISFTDVFRISSGGNIGINTNNPQSRLEVFTDDDTDFGDSSNTNNTNSLIRLFNKNGTDNTAVNNYVGIRFDVANGATSSAWLSYVRTGNNTGAFQFKARNGASSYPEVARITSDGQINLGNSGHGNTSVGGQEITGQDYSATLKLYDTRENMWGMQMRRDTGTGPNGIFVRAGNTSSNYSLYVCGTNERNTHLVCRGDGKVGIGTDAPLAPLEVQSSSIARVNTVYNKSKHLGMSVGGSGGGFVITDGHFMTVNHQPYSDRGTDSNLSERLRITSTGEITNKTTGTIGSVSTKGWTLGPQSTDGGYFIIRRDNSVPMHVNRGSDDGEIISLYGQSVKEGSISVSGSTVSYNPFLGSHWATLADWSRPEIKIGTILETINEIVEWKYAEITVDGEQKKICYNGTEGVGSTVTVEYEGQEYSGVVALETDPEFNKHVKVKINDTAGSKGVYGVFIAWNTDNELDGGIWNDMSVGAVGNYVIRIAAGQQLEIGDLVESDGSGCGVVQDDDIVRTKTVAKITSTIPQVTYDDGSFLVTCVLCCG